MEDFDTYSVVVSVVTWSMDPTFAVFIVLHEFGENKRA
jgi:uncharacterized membrane protein